MSRYSEVLEEFSRLMEQQLLRHDNRGDSWKDMSPSWLLRRLHVEARELAAAIRSGDARRIQAEAADVANFAMFLADNAAQPTTQGPI